MERRRAARELRARQTAQRHNLLRLGLFPPEPVKIIHIMDGRRVSSDVQTEMPISIVRKNIDAQG